MLRTGFTPTEFTEYPDGFSVTFKFKEPIAPGHIVKLVENTLTPRQKEIAEILKTKGPMNINSIGDQLKKHVPERTLRHELSSLKKTGYFDNDWQCSQYSLGNRSLC
ncbi:hypothetical protein QM565_06320 [Geitlerinema splendidum]|nr:hypothetical protein [Geitlerinema splendidum]